MSQVQIGEKRENVTIDLRKREAESRNTFSEAKSAYENIQHQSNSYESHKQGKTASLSTDRKMKPQPDKKLPSLKWTPVTHNIVLVDESEIKQKHRVRENSVDSKDMLIVE